MRGWVELKKKGKEIYSYQKATPDIYSRARMECKDEV